MENREIEQYIVDKNYLEVCKNVSSLFNMYIIYSGLEENITKFIARGYYKLSCKQRPFYIEDFVSLETKKAIKVKIKTDKNNKKNISIEKQKIEKQLLFIDKQLPIEDGIFKIIKQAIKAIIEYDQLVIISKRMEEIFR